MSPHVESAICPTSVSEHPPGILEYILLAFHPMDIFKMSKWICSRPPGSIIAGSWSWSHPHGISETRTPDVAPEDQHSAIIPEFVYHIVTPLVRSGGTTVLVDHGFLSKDGFEKLSKTAGTDEGVFVQAMLRVSDQVRNSFTADNHPEKGEWYRIVVDAMAKYAGAVDLVPPVHQSYTTFVPTPPSARRPKVSAEMRHAIVLDIPVVQTDTFKSSLFSESTRLNSTKHQAEAGGKLQHLYGV